MGVPRPVPMAMPMTILMRCAAIACKMYVRSCRMIERQMSSRRMPMRHRCPLSNDEPHQHAKWNQAPIHHFLNGRPAISMNCRQTRDNPGLVCIQYGVHSLRDRPTRRLDRRARVLSGGKLRLSADTGQDVTNRSSSHRSLMTSPVAGWTNSSSPSRSAWKCSRHAPRDGISANVSEILLESIHDTPSRGA